MSPTLDDYRWLIGDEGERWLRQVAQDPQGKPATPAIIRLLRTSLGTARTSLVLEQCELRAKAREKFTGADTLFFTRRGLEQATDEQLASYKTQRFAEVEGVADLCCGIGGDTMALAADHAITLVDRDEVSLLMADANCERVAFGVSRTCFAEDISAQHVAAVAAWHIDPDRRASGRRTSRVELGDPGVETIDQLLAANPHAAIKLAPAANLPDQWLGHCEREWIETRGECRQQVAWMGRLADVLVQHAATIVDESGEACSFSGEPNHALETASPLGPFLFDPSPSLVAARLVGTLAEAFGLAAVSPHSLYLTGADEIIHPHLQCFAVETDLPLDVRQLRAFFQSRGVGRLEIKKRGVDVTPESLREQLQLAGDNVATLILTRVGSKVRALVCQRIS